VSATPKRRWYQLSLRSLLVIMTLVAVLTGRITYLRRMADFHRTERARVQKHRDYLSTVSFDTPPKEWLRLESMDASHARLASKYQRAVWRPWPIVRDSGPTHEILDPRPAAHRTSRTSGLSMMFLKMLVSSCS
jgi:hypothetical protein